MFQRLADLAKKESIISDFLLREFNVFRQLVTSLVKKYVRNHNAIIVYCLHWHSTYISIQVTAGLLLMQVLYASADADAGVIIWTITSADADFIYF